MKKAAKVAFWIFFSFGLITAVGITAGGLYLTFTGKVQEDAQANERLSAQTDVMPIVTEMQETEESLSDIIEALLPSVVGVSSSGEDNSAMYMGSGVIATEEGHIITNQHVIAGNEERIIVTLHNGTTKEAKEIWSDSTLDLAVIKISGGSFTKAKLGNAQELRVGESVIAIGNPLSMQFERTVTAGIVSALNRTITVDNNGVSGSMEDLIQTDASINPGNSGGPLINTKGQVVGINTIKVSTAEGMGFAVPVDLCVPVIKRIQSMGEFKTPYLGLYAYTSEAARYLNKSPGFSRGLYVARLDSNGPAFAAGLRYGDIIVYADGAEINSMLSLRRCLFSHQPGESIKISFMRKDELHEVAVTLGETSKQG